jgi:hypothetical protein
MYQNYQYLKSWKYVANSRYNTEKKLIMTEDCTQYWTCNKAHMTQWAYMVAEILLGGARPFGYLYPKNPSKCQSIYEEGTRCAGVVTPPPPLPGGGAGIHKELSVHTAKGLPFLTSWEPCRLDEQGQQQRRVFANVFKTNIADVELHSYTVNAWRLFKKKLYGIDLSLPWAKNQGRKKAKLLYFLAYGWKHQFFKIT